MGQKVHPTSFRTGVTLGWKSRWYASKQEFADLLLEDRKIRKFIKEHPDKPQYRNAGISKIEIERTRDEVKVVLFVARPGLIIGKKGQEVEVLQADIQNLIGRHVNLKVEEVTKPELQGQLVAEDIAQQLARRASFRRTMKKSMEQAMEAGAKGIRVQLSGRLGGAEMARREKQSEGSVPMSTLRADIDYGFAESQTPQGNIGVQVWINRGMFEGDGTNGTNAEESQAQKKPKRSYKR
ncbi:MAG: 30S ribosomal protein S3 [Pirellulaceae bacterium]|nr:30S ribosomal protein S3 [Pirellulaceae bacterium]